MIRFDFKRLALILIISIVAQYLIGLLLGLLGIGGIYYALLMAFCMAVIFAYIYYPAPYRNQALRDPSFHKMLAFLFVLFFFINWLL